MATQEKRKRKAASLPSPDPPPPVPAGQPPLSFPAGQPQAPSPPIPSRPPPPPPAAGQPPSPFPAGQPLSSLPPIPSGLPPPPIPTGWQAVAGMKRSRKGETDDATTENEQGSIGSLLQLPVACVSHAISLTTPRDACRCSAVSRALQEAADSDAVWGCFLPTDYSSILARADDPVDLSSTKKELFRSLAQEPVLLDKGNRSFSLENKRGGKCYMLSARSLGIAWGWGNFPIHWRWISLPDSRFEQVAELLSVCWLHITGKIGSKELSPSTTYAAYLVFNLADDSYGLDSLTQEASITVGDNNVSKQIVSLYPLKQESQSGTSRTDEEHNAEEDQGEGRSRSYPRERGDGWLEVEMGEFYNDQGLDREVTILFSEIVELHWKKGLILEGMEIRPKHRP